MENKEQDLRIEQLEKIVIENNILLHRIDRRMKISQYMTILYWTILIGGAIGLYTFAKPFIDRTVETYDQVQQVTKTVNMLPKILFKK